MVDALRGLGGYRGPPMEEPQKASFAGPKANLNDNERRAYELAQRMEQEGRSREEIWKETGKLGAPWWKDSQGQWWMEFSDDKAKLKGHPEYRVWPNHHDDPHYDADAERMLKPNAKLEDIYDHPEMYRLYPKAKDFPAKISDLEGLTGYYAPKKSLKPGEKSEIGIDPFEFLDEGERAHPGPYDLAANAERKGEGGKTLTDVFVHEGQHFIQDEEDSFPNDQDHFPGEATPVEIHAALSELRRKMSMKERLAKPPWEMEEEAKQHYSRPR